MSKLHIVTQYMENYGAHDWDGSGECPQYWKNKGGEELFVLDVTSDQATQVMEALRPKVEHSTPFSREYVVFWQLVSDDFMTDFELQQLRWDGQISLPVRCLEINNLAIC